MNQQTAGSQEPNPQNKDNLLKEAFSQNTRNKSRVWKIAFYLSWVFIALWIISLVSAVFYGFNSPIYSSLQETVFYIIGPIVILLFIIDWFNRKHK